MAVSKKQKQPIEENLTVSEFKSWISGVEDMQGSDWHPTPEQWKKIRAKISILTDREVAQNNVQNNAPLFRQPSALLTNYNQQHSNVVANPTSNPQLSAPAPAYSDIDMTKIPDVISGDYTPAFL